jgi:hypothetical protein
MCFVCVMLTIFPELFLQKAWLPMLMSLSVLVLCGLAGRRFLSQTCQAKGKRVLQEACRATCQRHSEEAYLPTGKRLSTVSWRTQAEVAGHFGSLQKTQEVFKAIEGIVSLLLSVCIFQT